MEAILSTLPAADGVACFTRLYLAVTRGVQDRLAGAAFADPVFLARLDERFAEFFFEAVERPPPAHGRRSSTLGRASGSPHSSSRLPA